MCAFLVGGQHVIDERGLTTWCFLSVAVFQIKADDTVTNTDVEQVMCIESFRQSDKTDLIPV